MAGVRRNSVIVRFTEPLDTLAGYVIPWRRVRALHGNGSVYKLVAEQRIQLPNILRHAAPRQSTAWQRD